MNVSFLSIFVLCYLFIGTHSQNISAVPTSERGNTFSQISYEAHPPGCPTGISIKGVRTTIDKVNGTSSSEAMGYSIVVPPDNGQGVGFYFGYFSSQTDFDTGSSHNTSVSASLVELLVNFFTIFVYYERNGVPGYQHNVTDSFDCSATPPGADCMDWKYSLQMKSLSWACLVVKKIPCPANYSSSCKAAEFVIATNGTDDGIARFAFKISSQPVYIDGILVTPDYAKIDITLAYPWARYNYSHPNPKIGLIGSVAGKTASVNAVITRRDNIPGIDFNEGDKTATFAWVESSINSKKRGFASTVYSQNITDKQIISSCSDTMSCPILKVAIEAWQAVGWRATIMLFSWDTVKPSSVYWDPTVGINNSSSTSAPSPSSAPSGTTTGSPSGTTTGGTTTGGTTTGGTTTGGTTTGGTTTGGTTTGSPPVRTPSMSSGLVVSVFLSSLFVCLFSLLK